MYVQTSDSSVVSLDLARVNAGAASKPERPIGIEDRGRAANGPAWSVENREHAVTRDVDESPIKASKQGVGGPIVLVKKRSPSGVANLSSVLGGADQVDE